MGGSKIKLNSFNMFSFLKRLKRSNKLRKSFSAISVDSSFEVQNGMSGMMRDVIIHLCAMCNSSLNIRTIIGMCMEYYTWINHSYFKKIRAAVGFKQNPFCGYTVWHKAAEVSISFNIDGRDGIRTVFIDSPITKDICQWTVRIKYSKDTISNFSIGAVPSNRLMVCYSSRIGLSGSDSGCSFHFQGEPYPLSFIHGVRESPRLGTKVSDDSLVTIEAAVQNYTASLFFFVASVQVPYVVMKVPCPMHFGISGCGKPLFDSVSFFRLKRPRASAVDCIECEYNHY